MNFNNIKLENERNEHLKKRLNRLSTWGFFKVLYRNGMGRLFAFSLLMLLCAGPVIGLIFFSTYRTGLLLMQLPYYGSFGVGTGIWSGVTEFYESSLMNMNHFTGALMVAGGLFLAFMFSGGFAVIRDSFWTGDLKVFKRMGMGIKSNIFYALISAAVIGGSVFGVVEFFWWAEAALPLWLAIVLVVLLAIIAMFVMLYSLILCSVSVTYRQDVKQNLSDSWRLLWLNILPNILHLFLALLPYALYFIISGTFQMLILAFMMLFGGMYFPLVWQTHMMKTFALFHPVQVNKKGETKEMPSARTAADKA